MRRLGILGGTFDPIHHGHLVAAQETWHQLALDQVLFVPAGSPPHKRGDGVKPPAAPPLHRLRMIELAIAGHAQFAVSRVDLDRPGPCYTADMLRLLRAERGAEPAIYFIEGADSLADILKWYRPQEIIELAELAVVRRPGVTLELSELEEALPGLTARVHWVQMPWLDISSSDLRARLREGRPISYLVPPPVEAYIREHRLYVD
jgi:nicotinate-nucleotide adenylyltransferase